jgi:hypothetical protein
MFRAIIDRGHSKDITALDDDGFWTEAHIRDSLLTRLDLGSTYTEEYTDNFTLGSSVGGFGFADQLTVDEHLHLFAAYCFISTCMRRVHVYVAASSPACDMSTQLNSSFT